MSKSIFLFFIFAAILVSNPSSGGARALRLSLLAPTAAGDLDDTFGNGGRVTTDVAGSDFGNAVALQADGKIVVAGATTGGVAVDFILARYNTDGSLDTTFDGDGKVITNFTGGRDNATSVAVQSDGKIIAAGESTNPAETANNFALARYNTNGSLDLTFGGSGKVVTDFNGRADFARDIALQADGKIVLAGDTSLPGFAIALARYNIDGSLDLSFDGDGKVITQNLAERAYALALQDDGKIVIAGGNDSSGLPKNFTLARYNPDGSLDQTFDGDGKVITNFRGFDAFARALAIQSDGKIVVTGHLGSFPAVDFAVVRYNSDGAPDLSFGSSGNGKVITDFGSSDSPGGVAVQRDGTIIVAGGTSNSTADIALAYYRPDGSLDPAFGNGGKVITDFGTSDGASAIVIQADSKVVVAGSATVNGNLDFAVVRYISNTVQFGAPGFVVNEGDGNALVTVSREGVTAAPVTVDYITSDGTARQSNDYTLTAGTLTFFPGETSKQFLIPITDDLYAENSETVILTLLNPRGGAPLGVSSSVILGIIDNDPPTPPDPGPTPLGYLFAVRPISAQVVPANNSLARGVGSILLSANQTSAQLNLSLSDLSGQAGEKHIHGPAIAGVNGPVLFTLPDGNTIMNFNLANLTPAQVTDLRAGRWYLDAHSSAFPLGEIRGQIVANPVDDPALFVRQQYADFLSRTPDEAGLDFWTRQLTACATTPGCNISRRRREISNAFFFELEYQRTGSYVYRLNRVAYGNDQPFPNPNPDADGTCPASIPRAILRRQLPAYQNFAADRARIQSFDLANTQRLLAFNFTQRPEFLSRYPAGLATAGQFVDAALANLQTDLNVNLSSQRSALITLHNAVGGGDTGRSFVIYRLADDDTAGNPINNRALIDAEYNRSFVYSQYAGYLKRDADLCGINFWLNVINQAPLRDPNQQLGMVCAFITSAEYQTRFSPVSTRGNSECSP